jgi:hypothetical protein
VRYEHFRIGGQQIPLLELFTRRTEEIKAAGANAGSFKMLKPWNY